MKTIECTTNGHDCRAGFQSLIFSDKNEEKAYLANMTKMAINAHNRRLRNKSGKMRMSKALKTTDIPQAFDKFLMPRAHKACTLGALHIMAGGEFTDEIIDWWKVENKFDVYDPEWGRQVKCPHYDTGCFEKNALSAVLYHMNDEHHMSNYDIGKFLEKYDL